MNTTALYVEYVIIGLETLIWIVMSFYIIIGNAVINFIKYCIGNLFSAFLLIGICYILGLVTDRISDFIFEKRKLTIKNQYIIKSKTSLTVWGKYNQDDFAKFTLSRIRIVRATAINTLVIAILSTYLIYKYYFKIELMIFTFLLFMGISVFSNIAHKYLLNNYYKKTSILEKMTDNNKRKNK